MVPLPDGYEPADSDPLGIEEPNGVAVTGPGGAGRLFTGRAWADGPTAALLARRWARCRHPGLVPIEALGGEDPTWFATPAVDEAGAIELAELLEVMEAIVELHADGQRHGCIARSVVRGPEGLQLLPPWGRPEGDDHLALAQLLATTLTDSALFHGTQSVRVVTEAPAVLGGALGALREGRCLVVDVLVALRECEEVVAAGTELSVEPLRPAMALVPGEPPPPLKQRVTGPAALRARGLPLRPLDTPSIEAVWSHLREVATTGRPAGVVLRGSDAAVDGWEEWLQRTLEAWGLARTLCLLGGDGTSLVHALHPGGTGADEVESRWLGDAGRTIEDGAADAQRIRRWCGPLRDGERRAPAAVGRWELQRRIDAATGRGLMVVTMSAPTVEGIHLARDLCRGDGPVLVVLLVAHEREGDDELHGALGAAGFAEVAVATPPSDLGAWTDGDEVLEALDLTPSDDASPRELLQLLEARTDGAVSADASDGLEALAKASGVCHRVRDAVHLAALSHAPVAVLEGFLGPAAGLWHCTRYVRAVGATVRVEASLVAEAQARSDVRYLHRRLSRAWARAHRAGGALQGATHALASGSQAEAFTSFARAGLEARDARDGAALVRVADGLARAGSADAPLWRARAAAMRATDTVAQWEELAGSNDQQLAAEAAVGLARVAVRDGADDAADRVAAALKQAASCRATGCEGEAYALSARLADDGDADAGHGLYAKALHRLARARRPWQAAATLVQQAEGRARRGALSEARELYEDAVEAFLEVDDGPSAIRARLGAALCHVQVDQLDEAMGLAEQAQVEARAWLDPRGAVRAAALRARVERHAGSLAAAASRYDRVVREAQELGEHEVVVDAEIGRSLIALAHGDQHRAYECTTAAAVALETLPGHPLWARYRLAVSAQLAKRGDHMQTWQWLWSANELGLTDADRDVNELANQICNVAKLEGWGNVIRVSAAIAVEQLRRLGDEGEAERLRSDITGFITK